jgi:GNAT superfamily N-acetyltransferase
VTEPASESAVTDVPRVRPRTDQDLEACVELARVVQELDGYPPYFPPDVRGFLRAFLTPPGDILQAWVAEDVGEIVGHVALHRRSTDPVLALASEALQQPVEKLGVVARLFVSPAARHRGVGEMLLDVASGEAVGRGLFPILDVVTQFHDAIRLYERRGWIRAGQITVRFEEEGFSLDEAVYLGPARPPSTLTPTNSLKPT